MKRTIKKTKFNKTSALGLVAFFAVTGIFYIVLSRAATVVPPLGFYFNPTTTTVNQGSSFTVQVMANTGSNAIQSAAARVYYDNNKLQLTKANDITTGIDPAWEIRTSCSALNNVTNNGVTGPCKPAGEVVYIVGNSDPANLRPAGNYVVGNMTFSVRPGVTVGPSDITFDSGVQITTMVNPNATTQTALNARTTNKGTITIADITAPSVPTSLTSPAASNTPTSIKLNWAASTDDQGGPVGYKILRNGVQVGTATTNTYTDNGLTPSTSYTYIVSAYDNATPANNSAASAPLAVTTPADSQAPTVPQNIVQGTVGMTSIGMSWTGSTDNIAVAGYKIFRNGVQVGTSGTTNFTDNGPSPNGLTPGTNYSYTVSAYDTANPANNSAQSTAKVISTAADSQPPSVPAAPTVSATSATTVAISWNASTDNVGVASYRLYRNGTLLTTTTAPTTSFNDSGLIAGTYNYTVAAVDSAGNASQQSAAGSVVLYAATDLNKDGTVGMSDLTILLSNYGKTGAGSTGDVNADSIVNIGDIAVMLSKWGTAG